MYQFFHYHNVPNNITVGGDLQSARTRSEVQQAGMKNLISCNLQQISLLCASQLP